MEGQVSDTYVEALDADRAEIIREAWRRGRLRYKLKKCQRRIYDAMWAFITGKYTIRTFCLLISRQFGKSFTCVLVAIEFCIRNPGAQVRFAIPFSNRFEEMYGLSLRTIMGDMPPGVCALRDKRVRFSNGSAIVFGGVDLNPDALRGAASHLNFMDECGFMDEPRYVYESILFPQTKTTGGKTFFVSTPSESPDHDYGEIAHEHQEIKQLLKLTIDDDDELTQEQKDEMAANYGGYDATRFKREFRCMFVNETDMAIISEWTATEAGEDVPFYKRAKLVRNVERDQYFRYYHRYVALDSGAKDLTAVIFGYYDYYQAKLIVEDEFVINGPQMTTKLIAEKIKEKKHALWGDLPVYRWIADSANPTLIQDLAVTYGLPFVGVTKTRLLRVGDDRVEPGMINKLKVRVGLGDLIVQPRCKQVIGCLENGVWAKGKRGESFGKSKTYGHYDALAALVYLNLSIDIHTNPVPASHDLHLERQFYTPSTGGGTNWGRLIGKRN